MNTAEKSSKIMMTLSIINSNIDFDFVGWVLVIKTPCLFYFRSVKFHYVKETHMMLVAFWRWWKLLQHLGTKDNERIFVKIYWQLKTPTWKCTHCTMKMTYLYASDLPFKKLLQTRQTNRDNKRLSKQGLFMIKHCLGTQKLTRYQSKEFLT